MINISELFLQYFLSWSLENETTFNGHFFFWLICGNSKVRRDSQSLEVGRSALNPGSVTCQLCGLAKLLSLSGPGLLADRYLLEVPCSPGLGWKPTTCPHPLQKADRTTSRIFPHAVAAGTCWWGEQVMVKYLHGSGGTGSDIAEITKGEVTQFWPSLKLPLQSPHPPSLRL